MIFLGLTSASDEHKSSCSMKSLNKCEFVPSGQGGACANIWFFGGKDSWLVSRYHFCLKCQISGRKPHWQKWNNGLWVSNRFGWVLFFFFFMDLTELLP